MQTEMEKTGSAERFRKLRDYLVGDTEPPHGHLARDLSMTESAVRVTLHRMRQRFGAKLREQVARTVEDPEKTADELRYLISLIGA